MTDNTPTEHWVIGHVDFDGARVWWRPNACGYTTELVAAGLYSEREAKARGTRGSDKPMPLSETLRGIDPTAAIQAIEQRGYERGRAEGAGQERAAVVDYGRRVGDCCGAYQFALDVQAGGHWVMRSDRDPVAQWEARIRADAHRKALEGAARRFTELAGADGDGTEPEPVTEISTVVAELQSLANPKTEDGP